MDASSEAAKLEASFVVCAYQDPMDRLELKLSASV
jgi:hypothetical protein